MKLGKIKDGAVELIEVEDGKELGGVRTEKQLYAEGFKKACPSPSGTGEWIEYPTCLVQVEQLTEEDVENV